MAVAEGEGRSLSARAGYWTILLVLVFLGGFLRFRSLDADTWVEGLRRRPGEKPSGAFLSDEGWYNRNALRWAQGRRPAFQPGRINPGRITPLYFAAQSVVLSSGPPDLKRARWLSALCGCLLVITTLGLVRDPRLRLLAAGLVALDFVLVGFSRLATPDSLGLLMVAMSGVAVCRGKPLLAGVAVVAALAVKPTFLLPALMGVLLATPRDQRRFMSLGLVGAGLLMLLVWYLPHLEELQAFLTRLAPKRGLRYQDPLGTLHEGVWWFHWGPLLPLAIAAALGGGEEPEQRWAIGSLLGGLLSVAPFAYQPLRYHLVWVFPSICLAVHGLTSKTWLRWVSMLGFSGLLIFNLVRLQRVPSAYTLRDAAREAGGLVGPSPPTVLGHLADTFALEAGWNSVIPSVEYESEAVRERVDLARPGLILTLRHEEASRWQRELAPECRPPERLRSWDILENYYSGSPVSLWKLDCSRAPASSETHSGIGLHSNR